MRDANHHELHEYSYRNFHPTIKALLEIDLKAVVISKQKEMVVTYLKAIVISKQKDMVRLKNKNKK